MSTNHNSAATPILVALGLSATELEQLRGNGFVSWELRANGAIYKLRYRMDGQQRVRGLGSDPERAAAVERELAELQRVRRHGLLARQVAKQAREILRTTKAELEPHVLASGYAFHGQSIRKRRVRRIVDSPVRTNAS